MKRGFAQVDLLHEFLDPILVKIGFRLGLGRAFVGEDDLEAEEGFRRRVP